MQEGLHTKRARWSGGHPMGSAHLRTARALKKEIGDLLPNNQRQRRTCYRALQRESPFIDNLLVQIHYIIVMLK